MVDICVLLQEFGRWLMLITVVGHTFIHAYLTLRVAYRNLPKSVHMFNGMVGILEVSSITLKFIPNMTIFLS